MCVTDIKLQMGTRCEGMEVTIAAGAILEVPADPTRVGLVFPGRAGTGNSLSLIFGSTGTNQFARLSSAEHPLFITLSNSGEVVTKAWRIENQGAASVTFTYVRIWLPKAMTAAPPLPSQGLGK